MSGWRSLVGAETLAIASRRADLVIVDCRFSLNDPNLGEQSWLQGHIPGARYAHLHRDLSATGVQGQGRHPLPPADEFCARLARWGITPEHQVVAYDNGDGAMAAARLWWLLRALGHERVAVLDGGWRRWSALGLPSEGGPRAAGQGYFRGEYLKSRIAEPAELQRRRGDQPGWLIDARSAERFRGDEELLDRVAGHVPGAVNRPYTQNLQANGRFKPPVELAREFRALIGRHAPQDVVVMCGSGVTACHHVLAMERAGLYGARLYAGSWSGWISDPRRPVETGEVVVPAASSASAEVAKIAVNPASFPI